MPQRVSKLPQDIPLTRLLPNMLTLLSLCSGLTGMRYALLGRWEEAFAAVVIAAVFDMLDGRVARLLNITSKFGAELDSLSDAISFGVVPGFILYEWALKEQGGSLGWIAVLVYTVCAVLRLARFNTMLEDRAVPAWAKGYFTGVPAPGGAGLVLTTMPLVFEFGEVVRVPAPFLAVWMIVVGGLMVSQLPSLALKGWRITRGWVTPIFLAVALLIAAVVTNPWLTLSAVGITYLTSLPVGWCMYRRKMKQEKKA